MDACIIEENLLYGKGKTSESGHGTESKSENQSIDETNPDVWRKKSTNI